MRKSFPTTLGSSYQGRIVPPTEEESSYDNIPCFFDQNMRLLDKFYRVVFDRPFDECNNGPLSFSDYEPGDVFPEFSNLVFPNPQDFKDEKSYETALIDWINVVSHATSKMLTPYPIISKVFVPSRPSIVEKNTLLYRKFDQQNNPLVPQNMVLLHKLLLNNEKPNFEEDFPHQIPKRPVVTIKHQMAEDPQWQSQFLPMEPPSVLYATFEDYESAYINWYKLASQSITTPLINPREFKTILNINETPNFQPQQLDFKKISEEKNKSSYQLIDYSWIDSVHKSDLKSISGKTLSKIMQKEFRKSDITRDSQYDEFVFGVDKEEFLSDFENYGVHYGTLNSTSVHKPFKFVKYFVDKNVDAKLAKFREDLKTGRNKNIFEFLNLNYKLDKTKSIVQSLEMSEGTNRFYEDTYNFKNLDLLFDIASSSDQNMLRTAKLLEEMTFKHNAQEIVDSLLKPENIDYLFRLTNIALSTSTENLELFPVPKDKTEFSIKVEQMHLATLLLGTPIAVMCYPIERTLMRFCQKQSMVISKMLEDDALCETLWDSVKRDTPNENTQLMFTLESISSNKITYSLIGRQLYEKLIELTPYKIGRKFLFKLIFTKGGQASTPIISDNFKFINLTKKIDSLSAYIISLFIDEFAAFLMQKRCFVPMRDLNTILNQVLQSYESHLNPIIMSILNIFSNPKMISPSDEKTTDKVIENFTMQVGILCVIKKQISFSDAMMMYEPCLSFTTCLDQILSNPEFVVRIVEEMNGTSKKTVREAWKLFDTLISQHHIAKKLLEIPEIAKPLAQIAGSKSPFVFGKFSNFITSLVAFNDPELLDSAQSILSGSMGVIACTYKNSTKLFSTSVKAIESTERMIYAIVNTNGKFMTDLTTHLSSLDVDWKKKFLSKRRSISIL